MSRNSSLVYIGMNSLWSSGSYEWPDGSPVSYTNWDKGFAVDGGKNCIAMYASTGKWIDQHCDEIYGYICKQKKSGFNGPATPSSVGVANANYCRSGWTRINNVCYAYVQATVTFAEAEQACQNSGGAHLASVESLYQQAGLLWMVRNGVSDSHVWIGLNDRQTEGVYEWTDSTSVRYTEWAYGEPNSLTSSRDCVALRTATGMWDDRQCDEKRGYLCQLQPDQPTSSAVSSKCEKGWDNSDNKCYYLELNVRELRNYADARAKCQTLGAHLVHINDIYEQAFLAAYYLAIARWRSFYLWIGVNDLDSEGSYKAVDDFPIDFTFWRRLGPDNAGDCVEMDYFFTKGFSNGLWNDIKCTGRWSYICEKGVNPLSSTPPPPTFLWPGSCATGWQRWSNWCYNFESPLLLSWEDALSRCRTFGADLISLHSAAERDFVTQQFQRNNFFAAWGGLNDRNVQFHLVWSDQSPFDFVTWGSKEPNRNYMFDCGQLLGPGYSDWKLRQCGKKLNFACKAPVSKKVTSVQPTAASYPNLKCESGWIGHGVYCYYFSFGSAALINTTWENANSFCQQNNANLTSITSLDEDEFLSNTVNRTLYWIGFNDRKREGFFHWTDSSPITYTSWRDGEPNDVGDNEDCVVVSGSSWVDVPCSTSFPFVCKKIKENAKVTVPKTSLPTWGDCPSDWYTSTDTPYCYAVNGTITSWSNAESICSSLFPSRNSHLASILSVDESSLISDKVLPHFGYHVTKYKIYIGLNDREKEGSFKWTDGQPVLMTAWANNQPTDAAGILNCAVLTSVEGRWGDTWCADKCQFVCKMEKDQTTPPRFVTLSCSDTYTTCVRKGCQDRTTVHCPSGCDADGSAVYGYYVYSEDSSICRAALQSSRFLPRGGSFTLLKVSGSSYYTGARLNNISSMSKLSTTTVSFTFDFTDSTPHCDPGWIPNRDSCYYFVASTPSSALSYADATSACANAGAGLVIIDDEYEQSFLEWQLPAITGTVWIGLRKKDGVYVWADEKALSFEYWMKERSSSSYAENCVEIYPSGFNEKSGRWSNANCAKSNGFVCEISQGDAKSPSDQVNVSPSSPRTLSPLSTTSSTESKGGLSRSETVGIAVAAVVVVIIVVAIGVIVFLYRRQKRNIDLGRNDRINEIIRGREHACS